MNRLISGPTSLALVVREGGNIEDFEVWEDRDFEEFGVFELVNFLREEWVLIIIFWPLLLC